MHLVNRLNQSTVSYYSMSISVSFHSSRRRSFRFFPFCYFYHLDLVHMLLVVAQIMTSPTLFLSVSFSLALSAMASIQIISHSSYLCRAGLRFYICTCLCYGNNCWHSTRCMHFNGSPFLIFLRLLKTSARIIMKCITFVDSYSNSHLNQYFIVCMHMSFRCTFFFHFHLQSVSIR